VHGREDSVALSPEGTTDRREAAVAAALAGAVVVVLGYASGLGLETTNQVVAVQQPPTAVRGEDPVIQPSDHAIPATGVVGASHHTTGHVVHRRHDVAPTDHDHTPTTPASPTPSSPPEPEPEPPTADCAPAVLPALPLLAGLTQAVSSLLSGVVGDDLGCAVGEILDPTCCTSTVSGKTRQGVGG